MGDYVFYISIVDFDKNFRNKVVSDCREILFNDFKTQTAISTFDSMSDFFRKGKLIQYLDILIINTECIKGSKECFLNVLAKVQKMFNIHVMFYGEDVYDILLIYRVRHFYFILKNMFNEMFPKAISKGREIIISENKKIFITYNSKTDVIYLRDILYVKNTGRTPTIKTMKENFMSYSKLNFKVLLNTNFIQISRGCLISLQWIQSYNKDYVQMINGEKYRISRRIGKNAIRILSDLNVPYDKNILANHAIYSEVSNN